MAYSRLKKASSNACNGEVMVVPVQKRATGEKLYLALQSVPFGPSGRTNVGINYKPLAAATDFDTPANFSNNWEGAHEASRIGSAYSTMTWQNDNTLGFLYEEETFRTAGQGGYTIVYKNYSIEQITDSVYTYAADNSWTVADDLRTKMVEHRVAAITAGKYVGQYTAAAAAAANAAAATYNAAPSAEAYEQFNAQMEQLPTVEVDSKKLYRLRNEGYVGTQGALYLKANVGGTAYERCYPRRNGRCVLLRSPSRGQSRRIRPLQRKDEDLSSQVRCRQRNACPRFGYGQCRCVHADHAS